MDDPRVLKWTVMYETGRCKKALFGRSLGLKLDGPYKFLVGFEIFLNIRDLDVVLSFLIYVLQF